MSARLFSQIMPSGVKEILASTAYRFLPLKRPWLVQIYRTTTVSEDISMTYFLGQSNRIYALFLNLDLDIILDKIEKVFARK